MKYLSLTFLILFFNILCASAIAVEEEDTLTDMSKPERCLTLRSIKRMKVIDDQNILFYTRGKKLYQNTLTRKCNGLRSDSVLSYKASLGRLCRMDTITAQDNMGGQFNTTGSCTLGDFEQIPTKEELSEED